jgi:hypothetical protein
MIKDGKMGRNGGPSYGSRMFHGKQANPVPGLRYNLRFDSTH